MRVENSHLINSLLTSTPTKRKPRQATLPSSVVLIRVLPGLASLASEGAKQAKRSKHSHILSESLATALSTPLDARAAAAVPKLRHAEAAGPKDDRRRANSSSGANPDGSYEAFQILRAIEKHDIMLLMEVKARQFELLTTAVGGTTPLVHAMRLGKSHRDIAILLTGAISRKVNDVSDNELDRLEPATRSILRSIRANLKVAIQYGLSSSQTDLIASYLQVIIMSEGDKFIHTATNKVALALRAGPAGKPVASASAILAKWMSRELKEQEVASVGEYVANATSDLVLLGLWNVATDAVAGETIPTYYFARDDRITKALDERLDDLKKTGAYKKLSKLVRRQLEISVDIMLKRNVGGRERVEMLRSALDEG